MITYMPQSSVRGAGCGGRRRAALPAESFMQGAGLARSETRTLVQRGMSGASGRPGRGVRPGMISILANPRNFQKTRTTPGLPRVYSPAHQLPATRRFRPGRSPRPARSGRHHRMLEAIYCHQEAGLKSWTAMMTHERAVNGSVIHVIRWAFIRVHLRLQLFLLIKNR